MSDYTIKDIASMAGVSTGTVSRILNNAGNVDEALRRRTLEVIERIQYKPAPRGRQPGQRRSAPPSPSRLPVAVVSPEMARAWTGNQLWMDFMSGIERACVERGYGCTAHFSGEDAAARDAALRHACGILMKTPDHAPEYLEDVCARLPVVLFGAYNPQLRLPQVALDHYASGVLGTEHLLGKGHRRIAFVNSMMRYAAFISRSRGYVDVMRHHGLYDPEHLIELNDVPAASVQTPEKTPPDMRGVLERLMKMKQRPTAVFFANDWSAIGFYQACARAGVSIPDTFSVVGVDDQGGMCEAMTPTLTSVAMPFSDVGYFAAATLLDMVEGVGQYRRDVPSVQHLAGSLHARASVRECPAVAMA